MNPINKYLYSESKSSISNENSKKSSNQIEDSFENSDSTLHPFQINSQSNSSELSLAEHPFKAEEISPLDVLHNDISTIVLDYCAGRVFASLANYYARQNWYTKLKREIEPYIKVITREINCDSNTVDAEIYCLEVSAKIHKFVRNAGIMDHLSKNENNFEDLNLIPIAKELKIIIDEDLCTVFEKISKEITNEKLSQILLSHSSKSDKAEFIRKWLAESNERKCLENITDLGLNRLGLKTLPYEIYRFKKVEKLYLANNSLQQVPSSIKRLKYLIDFDITENNLQQLPKEFFKLKQLQMLNLSSNLQIKISEKIGQLTELKSLYLWNINLKVIPNSFRYLRNLEFLALSHNYLEEIPDFIGQFNLKYLGLGQNNLNYIPYSISQMPDLNILEITNNPLKELHPDFLKLQARGCYINLSNYTLYKLTHPMIAQCKCIIS